MLKEECHKLKTLWLKQLDPDQEYLKQGIRTFLAGFIAILIYRYQQTTWHQGYWILLASSFLMQTRVGLSQKKQVTILIGSVIVSSIMVFFAGLASGHVIPLAIFLGCTTFLSVYLGSLGHVFAVSCFFVNLFVIISAGLQTDMPGLLQRSAMMLLGGFIAVLLCWLWPTKSKKIKHDELILESQSIFLTLKKGLTLSSVPFRRALRMMIIMFFSVLIYRYFSLTQGFWVPLTVSIVMQGTTEETMRKGWHRTPM